jgi:hypothetical protein
MHVDIAVDVDVAAHATHPAAATHTPHSAHTAAAHATHAAATHSAHTATAHTATAHAATAHAATAHAATAHAATAHAATAPAAATHTAATHTAAHATHLRKHDEIGIRRRFTCARPGRAGVDHCNGRSGGEQNREKIFGLEHEYLPGCGAAFAEAQPEHYHILRSITGSAQSLSGFDGIKSGALAFCFDAFSSREPAVAGRSRLWPAKADIHFARKRFNSNIRNPAC